ncbi:MAG: deoxyguanosinetriphosphate triphosphohydrolase, partial [Terriglobia bacterium]
GLIEHTRRALAQNSIDSLDAVRRHPQRLAGFSPAVARQSRALKQFLNRHLYSHQEIIGERERAAQALDDLFQLYLAHPDRLPRRFFEQTKQAPVQRVVCDYLAGMTDTYTFRVHQQALAAASRS